MKSTGRLRHWEEFVSSVNDSGSTQDSKYHAREEVLQAKGKMYQMHIQKLKLLSEQEEMASAPFHPTINSNYESKEK